MKQLLALAVLASLCVAGYAQGTVNFATTAATSLKYSTLLDKMAPADAAKAGTTVAKADFKAALYYRPAGSAAELVQIGASASLAANGTILAGTRTTPDTTAAGGTADFQVRVWGAAFATYDDALTAQNTTTTGAYAGQSAIFSNLTGGGTSPAKALSFTAFPIEFKAVPEPSTIALGLMGLAGLFLARRRQ